ncbi:hypothetical protein BDK51DRAFT_33288, partial [Blyttiomyces helicus]
PDFENLLKAQLKIEIVVAFVNERAREAESVHRMLDLQGRFTSKLNILTPSRLLIKAAPMDLLSANGDRKRREIFMFNDMLLVAKGQGGGGEGEKLKVVSMVPFDMILINSPSDDPGKENLIEIVHIGSAKFTLACDSAFTKTQWIKAFKEATDGFIAQKNRSGAGGGAAVAEQPAPVPSVAPQAAVARIDPMAEERDGDDGEERDGDEGGAYEDSVIVKDDVPVSSGPPPFVRAISQGHAIAVASAPTTSASKPIAAAAPPKPATPSPSPSRQESRSKSVDRLDADTSALQPAAGEADAAAAVRRASSVEKAAGASHGVAASPTPASPTRMASGSFPLPTLPARTEPVRQVSAAAAAKRVSARRVSVSSGSAHVASPEAVVSESAVAESTTPGVSDSVSTAMSDAAAAFSGPSKYPPPIPGGKPRPTSAMLLLAPRQIVPPTPKPNIPPPAASARLTRPAPSPPSTAALVNMRAPPTTAASTSSTTQPLPARDVRDLPSTSGSRLTSNPFIVQDASQAVVAPVPQVPFRAHARSATADPAMVHGSRATASNGDLTAILDSLDEPAADAPTAGHEGGSTAGAGASSSIPSAGPTSSHTRSASHQPQSAAARRPVPWQPMIIPAAARGPPALSDLPKRSLSINPSIRERMKELQKQAEVGSISSVSPPSKIATGAAMASVTVTGPRGRVGSASGSAVEPVCDSDAGDAEVGELPMLKAKLESLSAKLSTAAAAISEG